MRDAVTVFICVEVSQVLFLFFQNLHDFSDPRSLSTCKSAGVQIRLAVETQKERKQSTAIRNKKNSEAKKKP